MQQSGRGRAAPPTPGLFIGPGDGGGIRCPNRVAGVASCIAEAAQGRGAEDPADGRGRARVAREGSHVSLIKARRPVFRGEFETARAGQHSSQSNHWADRRS